MDTRGKTILVTGANRGLGRQFTQALLAAGAAKVYAGARDPKTVTQPGVHPVRLDVTDEDRWVAVVAGTVDRYGKLNVVVNNAGMSGRFGRPVVEETTVEGWDAVFDVNAKGVFLGTKHAIPEMRKAGGGSIINV